METLRLGSHGPMTELLQSRLRKTGYAVMIDGIFGQKTQNAVRAFQTRSGLAADGVVGPLTWRALRPFETVPTDIRYSSEILTENIDAFTRTYPFLEHGYIGRSGLSEIIPYIRLGTGKREVFYCASAHANEWLTTPVLMKFAENFLNAYVEDSFIFGFRAKKIYQDASIYMVPMVNPDGVDLVTGAMPPWLNAYKAARRIAGGFPNIPFPNGWKANIAGTDLNRQFPANWEKAKAISEAAGVDRPAPRDYVGPAPLSAPEAAAVYDFTRAHDFRLILSYHSQGRVIYWRYLNYLPPGSAELAQLFADVSGYALEDAVGSYAGYKDWFIQEYNRPGYTIEVGLGKNPLPVSQFDEIYRENEGILVLAAVQE